MDTTQFDRSIQTLAQAAGRRDAARSLDPPREALRKVRRAQTSASSNDSGRTRQCNPTHQKER
jgi:hypothetical protein